MSATTVLGRPWVRRALLATGYAAAVLLGRATRLPGSDLSLVWPAAGIAVLWLAGSWADRRARTTDLALLLVVTWAVSTADGSSPAVSVALAVADVVEAAVTVAVAGRLRPGALALRSLPDLWALVLAAVAGAVVSAAVGPVATSLADGAEVLPAVGTWVIRMTTSAVLVTAIGLRLRRSPEDVTATAGPAERALLTAVSAAAYAGVFVLQSGSPLSYVVLPVGAWAALRLPTRAAALHVLAAGTAAVVATLLGGGPFAAEATVLAVVVVQGFVAVLTALVLALALHRDERAELTARLDAARSAAERESALLAAVYATTSDGVIVFDAEGRSLLRNHAATAMLGDAASGGSSTWQRELSFSHPDGRPCAPRDLPVAHALAGEDVAADLVIASPEHPEGRTYAVSAHPLPAAPGAPWSGGAVAAMRDVTAARQAAADVAAARDLYSAVLDATVDQSVIGVDLRGRITVFNTGAERLTGWTAAEVVGRSAVLVHDPDELAARAAELGLRTGTDVLGHLVRAHGHEVGQWTYRTKDGGRRQVHLSLTPLRGEDGATSGYLGVATDVTDRLEVERQLADSEELFRLAFQTAPTGMAVVCLTPGSAGLVRRANPAFARFTGRPVAEVVEHLRVRDLLHPDDAPAHEEALARAAATGRGAPDAVERRFRTPGGQVRVGSLSTSVISPSDGSEPYLLVLIEDVTERRAAQDALQHLASHDALTGLPNRALLRDHLDLALAGAARTGRGPALLFVDLDGFKAVNDTHGHAAGDALLREVAARLVAAVRGGDTVARLGGDEFAVLCPGTGVEEAAQVAARLVAAVGEDVDLGGGARARAGASVGVAVADGAQDADSLLGEADHAMYAAKRAGGSRAVLAGAGVGAGVGAGSARLER